MVSSCILFAACTTQTNHLAQLPAADQALAWHGEREKNFGFYDYLNVASAQEAEDLLNEKFQVEVTDFWAQSLELLAETAFLQAYPQQQTTYHVVASEKRLSYQTVLEYGINDQLQAKAQILLVYTLDAEQQWVKLEEQTLLLETAAEEGKETTAFYEALPELSKGAAEFIDLPDVEASLETFLADYSAKEEQMNQVSVPIASNQEASTALHRSIQVYYDALGVLREFYVNVYDATE